MTRTTRPIVASAAAIIVVVCMTIDQNLVLPTVAFGGDVAPFIGTHRMNHRSNNRHNIPSPIIIVAPRPRMRFPDMISKAARGNDVVDDDETTTDTLKPDFTSQDPFRVLGIAPTADAKRIKRAYKKLALRYHPDVVVTVADSAAAAAERKKQASDRFARINWAYQVLSGKDKQSRQQQPPPNSNTRSTSTGSSSSSSSSWTPPHRRKGAYQSSSSTGTSSSSYNARDTSEDWRTYIPNYGQEYDTNDPYNTNGDSFGAIFNDLFANAMQGGGGAASAVGSGARVWKDFMDFLESNFDEYGATSSSGMGGSRGTSSSSDTDLQYLLQTGTVAEVGEEMDETDLIVQQLNTKLRNIQDEMILLQAERAQTTKFTEQLGLDERLEELQARRKVAENYLNKARQRLLALQTRYKQLIQRGANDPKAGGGGSQSRSGSVWDDYQSPSSSQARDTGPQSSSYTKARSDTASDPEDAWKTDSFGSYGRGRSRRRSGRTSSSESEEAPTDTSTSYRSTSTRRTDPETTNPSPREESRTTETRSEATGVGSRSSQTYNEPPHRRSTASNFESKINEDKRRLRELQVNDEFEKLKRDLGL